jgi:hypothetical protein
VWSGAGGWARISDLPFTLTLEGVSTFSTPPRGNSSMSLDNSIYSAQTAVKDAYASELPYRNRGIR